MVNLHRLILTVALALTVAGFAAPAAAIKSDEALALCRQRGPDCKAMKVSAGDSVTVIICVNNSSTGNGVQCVQCATGRIAQLYPGCRKPRAVVLLQAS